jgi:hypothetical protein
MAGGHEWYEGRPLSVGFAQLGGLKNWRFAVVVDVGGTKRLFIVMGDLDHYSYYLQDCIAMLEAQIVAGGTIRIEAAEDLRWGSKAEFCEVPVPPLVPREIHVDGYKWFARALRPNLS